MSIFTGELVRLTALRRDDLPTYTRWFQDYEMRRYLSLVAAPATAEQEEAWYERAVKDHGKGSYTFAIRALADDRLLGNAGLQLMTAKDRWARFGIFLGERDTWGQGYGTDATRLILRYAFLELGLHRVELDVYSFNPRGVRAYEKAGFRREATRREALYREGQYHDIHVMGILRPEWEALYPQAAGEYGG